MNQLLTIYQGVNITYFKSCLYLHYLYEQSGFCTKNAFLKNESFYLLLPFVCHKCKALFPTNTFIPVKVVDAFSRSLLSGLSSKKLERRGWGYKKGSLSSSSLQHLPLFLSLSLTLPLFLSHICILIAYNSNDVYTEIIWF